MSLSTTTPLASAPAPTRTVGAAERLVREPDFTDRTYLRSFTMFQSLYADLARAHRRRRQRGYERKLEQHGQRDYQRHVQHQLMR